MNKLTEKGSSLLRPGTGAGRSLQPVWKGPPAQPERQGAKPRGRRPLSGPHQRLHCRGAGGITERIQPFTFGCLSWADANASIHLDALSAGDRVTGTIRAWGEAKAALRPTSSFESLRLQHDAGGSPGRPRDAQRQHPLRPPGQRSGRGTELRGARALSG
jgi:hypothetical protein